MSGLFEPHGLEPSGPLVQDPSTQDLASRVCDFCGSAISAKRKPGTRYCDLKCGNNYRYQLTRGTRRTRAATECKRCSSKIPDHVRTDSLFCSSLCRKKYSQENRVKSRFGFKRGFVTKCLECSTAFEPKNTLNKFCDEPCRSEYSKRLGRAVVGSTRACRECGDEYISNSSMHKLCSPLCVRVSTRRKSRARKFGVDENYIERSIEAQGGCAVCGRREPAGKSKWNIDHDHKCCPGGNSCGQCVRGVLCMPCNSALGNFGDSIEILLGAIKYLQNFEDIKKDRAASVERENLI